MKLQFFAPITDWSDYYLEENEIPYEQLIIKGSHAVRRVYTEGQVYIKHSLFESLKRQENGGAVYFSSNDEQSVLLIEDSQIIFCSCQKCGGGIYKTEEGSFTLSRVCGFGCTSTEAITHNNDGPFCFVHTTESKNSSIVDSSVVYCHSTWSCTLLLGRGKWTFQNMNLSHNLCDNTYSCFRIFEVKLGTSFRSSSFRNNTAKNWLCFGIQESETTEITLSNIIENTQNGVSEGLIRSHASQINIKNTCIYHNTPNDKVFYLIYSGKIALINCTVDTKTFPSGVTTNEMTPSNGSFVNYISHLNTGKCLATYDYVEDLTFNPPTPKQTPTQTRNPYLKIITNNHSKHRNIYFLCYVFITCRK